MLASQKQRSILNEEQEQVLTRRTAQEPITLGSCSAGGQHPGDELAGLYTIVQRGLHYTKMAAAVSFVIF